MAWRPPRTLTILGKPVLVKLASAEELKDVVADHKTPWGAWDDDMDTIYILRTASGAKREEAYWHELMHCLIDRFLDR